MASPANAFAATLDRSALALALGSVIKAVESGVVIPILAHVLISASDGAVTVTACNLDQNVTTSVAADVDQPGTITLPGKALHDIARKLPADARVTIRVETDKPGTALIQSGRSRFSLPSLPERDYPTLLDEGMTGPAYAIELAGGVLADLIGRCEFAISSEETRYYLNGIYAHVIEAEAGPTLRFVATDGHRLARIDTTHATGLDPTMPGVILPTKGVELFSAAAKIAGDAKVILELTPTKARLKLGNSGQIVTKLIDGTYPDYARVVPTQFARESYTATLGLAAMLERVGAVSAEKTRRVKCTFEADKITASLFNVDDGSTAADEVDAELTGEPLEIGFNARFFADILKYSRGDTVRVRLGSNAGDPVVITDKTDTALYVLMPMRI